MSSITTHIENATTNFCTSNRDKHPANPKRKRKNDTLNVSDRIRDLKQVFKKSWKTPDLPLAQLLKFYQISLGDDYDEIEINGYNTQTLTTPEHRNCLLGKINDRSEAIRVALSIHDYVLRNEALFCAIIFKPTMKDLPLLQELSKQVEIDELVYETVFAYYLALVKDPIAISEELIDWPFFNKMMTELPDIKDPMSDEFYRLLAIAFADRNKVKMAEELIEVMSGVADFLKCQRDVILTIAERNPANYDQQYYSQLMEAKRISQDMYDDADANGILYDSYYPQSIIPLAITLLRYEDTSLLREAVSLFFKANKDVFNVGEIYKYGAKFITAILQSTTLSREQKSRYIAKICQKLGPEFKAAGG